MTAIKPISSLDEILILGAGDDQCPSYLEAKSRNLYVIGVDKNPDAPGLRIADEVLSICTRSINELKIALENRKIRAVIGPASDAAQQAVYHLSRHFNTAFQPSWKSVCASEHKAFFLEGMESAGFKMHGFLQSESLNEIMQNVKHFKFPLVLKPSDGSGSKGITLAKKLEDLPEKFHFAQKHSFYGNVIVEEFLEGEHYSAECFVRGGQPEFIGISKKVLGGSFNLMTDTHYLPAELSQGLLNALEEQISKICSIFCLKEGSLNLDLVISKDEVIHFIEMGARLAGNGMVKLIEEAYGVNLLKASVDLALGKGWCVEKKSSKFALMKILYSSKSGTLKTINGDKAVQNFAGVRSLEIFAKPGMFVKNYSQSAHKIGYLMLCRDTINELDALLQKSVQTLQFEIV